MTRIAEAWPQQVYAALQGAGVKLVAYVPDAGHTRLIELCHADPAQRAVVLSTEEEGIGIAAGAWLGGMRSALLMQSSGVGNCINALGMVAECRFPLLMVVTMRGEAGETNPWQLPMGRATPAVLAAMGVEVRAAARAEEIAPAVAAGARRAFDQSAAVAVLIAQQVIGVKSFDEPAGK